MEVFQGVKCKNPVIKASIEHECKQKRNYSSNSCTKEQLLFREHLQCKTKLEAYKMIDPLTSKLV